MGEIGGPAGLKTPQVSGIGRNRTYTTRTQSQSLSLLTKARNLTLDLSGCRAGGEEDGGEGSKERRKEGRGKRSRGSSSEGDACMQNRLGSDIKSAVRNCSQALTTIWLIVSLAKAQLASQR